jgi:ATP-binding cassette subfamily F protein 3
MLQLQNLCYSIGDLHLLQDVQWIINPGKRIALIGPNGTGKTTLLRILVGQLEPFDGKIIKPKDYQIGYLPQEEMALDTGTVLSTALEGHAEVLQIEDEMQNIQRAVAEKETKETEYLDRLGDLESRYHVLGGYALESSAKKILAGLGFKQDEFHRSLSEMSGGWRMRAYLAKLLIQEPDLLLLDEPTNHLDLESLEWIENYLKNFSGSMIIVSHDRYFIDRLAHEIAELYSTKLTHYTGNYRFYEQKKTLEQEQLIKKWEAQKEERQRIQRFIDRFRYKNTKAAQVQSRVKLLEKMERIELPKNSKTIRFKIEADMPSYHEVLKIRNMSFRYAEDWVFEDINLDLYRGDKVALVGVNGAGKTTLTRLISGELAHPQEGSLTVGQRVQVGYYAQHRVEALNMNNTVYDEVVESAARSFQPKLRDILGLFQFTGDDIEKPINVLSGGEKARVSLAKILLSPSNFIIMDEPTNHLDVASMEALEQALWGYNGTLLLISHDRYFLDKLVTRVIELRDGTLREFTGNYSEYLEKRESEAQDIEIQTNAERSNNTPETVRSRAKKSKEQKKEEALARQAVSKERNRLRDEIEAIESEIDQLEEEKSVLEGQLADPETYQNQELSTQISKRYDQIRIKLPQLEAKWEEYHLRHEQIIRNLNSA